MEFSFYFTGEFMANILTPVLTKVTKEVVKTPVAGFKVKPLNEFYKSPYTNEETQLISVARLAPPGKIQVMIDEIKRGNPRLYEHLTERLEWLDIELYIGVELIVADLCENESDVALYCHAIKRHVMDNPTTEKELVYVSDWLEMFGDGVPPKTVRTQAWFEQITPNKTNGVNDPKYW